MAVITDQQIANVAMLSGWSANDVTTAVAVALAESGGKDDAIGHNLNGTIDRGLWQVNSVHLRTGGILAGTSIASLLTAVGNGTAAHRVWAVQGWAAWSTYKSGAYRLYLSRAQKASSSASTSGGNAGEVVTKPSPLEALANAAVVPFRAAAWIGNPHNWVRVLEVGTGAALVVAGLSVVASSSKPLRTVRKVVP